MFSVFSSHTCWLGQVCRTTQHNPLVPDVMDGRRGTRCEGPQEKVATLVLIENEHGRFCDQPSLPGHWRAILPSAVPVICPQGHAGPLPSAPSLGIPLPGSPTHHQGPRVSWLVPSMAWPQGGGFWRRSIS